MSGGDPLFLLGRPIALGFLLLLILSLALPLWRNRQWAATMRVSGTEPAN